MKALLHRLVAIPFVYDLVQKLVGGGAIREWIREPLAAMEPGQKILDVGAGTGLNREVCPKNCKYICLDLDPVKLRAFQERYPDDSAVQADATSIPLEDNSVDAVLCTLVTHHLPKEVVPKFVAESHRVLKPSGRLIFVDAFWEPRNRVGQLLWRFDRGSYPHTRDELLTDISQKLRIVHQDHQRKLHDYLLVVGAKA
jgi:ubiquinone/menaquinone biosynthesis C-methylase UbiE